MKNKSYSYQKEKDEYVLYDGDKKLCNPHNEVISTENEELAVKLVEALENGEDYTSGTSLLCYHYTYCNLRKYTTEELVEDFTSYMTYDTFLWDPYLMFKQGAPVKQAFAGAFSEMFPKKIKTFNMYQLVAILILHQVYDSWMLSYRIISDIIEQLDSSSYDELKEDFMEELDEYERTELAEHTVFCDDGDGDDVDEEEYDEEEEELFEDEYDEEEYDKEDIEEEKYARFRSELSLIIDKFTYYFTL